MRLYFIERKFLAISVLTFLFVSCVTTKSKDDLSTVGKIYHNTTAKYNGYFNAKELYKASRLQVITNFQDNYTKLLPLYPEMESDNAKAVTENMDEAIKKLGVVINLHRTSKWIDDSYLLIGKSQFLKQDYQKAKETFAYLVDEFNPDNQRSKNRKITKAKSDKARAATNKNRRSSGGSKTTKEKKQQEKTQKQKQKERQQQIKDRKKAAKKGKKTRSSKRPTTRPPSQPVDKEGDKPKTKTVTTPTKKKSEPKKEEAENKGMFSHEPAYYEGLVWLARTYTIQGYHLNASTIFTDLKNSGKASNEVLKEMEKARANAYIEQEDYPSAILALNSAYDLAEDKSEKARFAFLNGQLQMKTKDYPNAQVSFENVLDARGDYEMDFNAKLSLLKLEINNGKRSEKEAIANIERMVKDQKNIEYRDQLYYTLALIQLEKNDKIEAIKYLKLAVAQKVNNQIRKSESYYLLADLYYESEQYVNAKNYFDSTLQVLPKIDDRYPRVQKLAGSLTEIAANIETIARLDSFIMVSKMSDQDKRKLALRIKKEREAEAEAAANQAVNAENKAKNSKLANSKISNPILTTAGSNSSSFFAYDEKELKRGFKDFKDKWGSRALEDNWRRSLRSDANLTGIVAEDTGEEVEDELIGKNEIGDILRDIPKNAQDVARLEGQIQEAKFQLGRLFREKLENYEKSAEILEELLSEFPETPKKIDSYYYLYLDYIDLDNTARAKIYYDKIIAEAPDSEFAKVLLDPNYLNSLAKDDQLIYTYYDETYDLYNEGNITEAFDRVKNVNKKFKENPLKAKFALLNAFCVGKVDGKDAYINSLKDVVANYPNSAEQTHAKELLRILYGGKPEAGGSSILRYSADMKSLHYAIVILYKMEGKTSNNARTFISDFNKKYYKEKKLKAISSLYLDQENSIPMLIIRDFTNGEEAMRYYDTIAKNQENFLDDAYEYEVYVTSRNNYREIYKTKKVEEYKAFFEENYLKK